MSTRVLPVGGFFNFSRMSELRRRLEPPASAAQPEVPQNEEETEHTALQSRSVRRNLFGPIDHDENMKFVQEELSKIATADRSRWNFDFQKEKPLGGRYSWERPRQGHVPAAYGMPNLTAKLTLPNPFPSTSKITSSADAERAAASAAPSPITVSLKASNLVTTAPASTTIDTSVASKATTQNLQSAIKQVTTASATVKPVSLQQTYDVEPPGVPRQIGSSKPAAGLTTSDSVVSTEAPDVEAASTQPVASINAKQTKITEFLKIRKRSRSSSEAKIEPEDVVPSSLKKARTST